VKSKREETERREIRDKRENRVMISHEKREKREKIYNAKREREREESRVCLPLPLSL